MLKNKTRLFSLILVILHIVGVIGTLLSTYRALTVSLTPINLILSALLLLSAHKSKHWQFWCYVVLVFSFGLMIEIIGTNTGFPFGSYTYGSTLGPKVLNTPVIIGINWLLLSYSFAIVASRARVHYLIEILLAASGMVVFDFLIEPVAISLDYWTWASAEIPWQNYVSWFIIAATFQLLYHFLIPKTKNPLALVLLLSQLFYFGMVLFFTYF